MRNILITTAILSSVLFSCTNIEKKKGDDQQTAPMAVTKETANKPAGKIDPVCEMPYDAAWTDLTIYNGDTIRFCSENCKKAFLVRPAKYVKK